MDLWIKQAISLHREGRLAEAERLYLTVLRAKPNHFDAQHMLGVLRHQQGRNAEAIGLLGGAVEI